MTELFIDVSFHDWDRRGRALDWGAIRAAGLGTVMCARASYGDPVIFSPPSPYFAETMAAAAANGYTCRGAYHNLIHGDQASINRQVDLLRSTMDRYGGEWAMADVEAYGELVARGLVPTWTDVQRFHDRWYSVDGRRMAWYIAEWFWSGHLGSPNLTGLRGALINANYPGVTGSPTSAYASAGGNTGRGFTSFGGRPVDIWQFGSTITVNGASSNTDCNAFRGSIPELVALLTGGTVPNGGTIDMPLFLRVNETGACWVSDGPTRSTISSMDDLTELRAAYPSVFAPGGPGLRAIPLARLGAYGVDVGAPEDHSFTLSAAQMAELQTATADELAAVTKAAAAGVMAEMPAIVDALVARLPAGTMTREDVEGAVRDAFAGGLALDADAPPAPPPAPTAPGA